MFRMFFGQYTLACAEIDFPHFQEKASGVGFFVESTGSGIQYGSTKIFLLYGVPVF
jgi:hypothetical protein